VYVCVNLTFIYATDNVCHSSCSKSGLDRLTRLTFRAVGSPHVYPCISFLVLLHVFLHVSHLGMDQSGVPLNTIHLIRQKLELWDALTDILVISHVVPENMLFLHGSM
jgi:hypothetical protein